MGSLPLAIMMDIFFVFSTALLWPTTRYARTQMESREQLRRLSRVLQLESFATSIYFWVRLLQPLSQGGRLMIVGTDGDFALLIEGISYGLAAFTFSQSARGKLQQWLGSHLLTRSGSKEQEASFVAGLICGIPADQIYIIAQSLFRGESVKKIKLNHDIHLGLTTLICFVCAMTSQGFT